MSVARGRRDRAGCGAHCGGDNNWHASFGGDETTIAACIDLDRRGNGRTRQGQRLTRILMAMALCCRRVAARRRARRVSTWGSEAAPWTVLRGEERRDTLRAMIESIVESFSEWTGPGGEWL